MTALQRICIDIVAESVALRTVPRSTRDNPAGLSARFMYVINRKMRSYDDVWACFSATMADLREETASIMSFVLKVENDNKSLRIRNNATNSVPFCEARSNDKPFFKYSLHSKGTDGSNGYETHSEDDRHQAHDYLPAWVWAPRRAALVSPPLALEIAAKQPS